MSAKTQFVQELIHWMELSTTRSMRHWGHYVRQTGLSMPQFGLLMHLYHHASCGMAEISQHSGASQAAASQLVDRLVDKQLVIRTENQADRRSKQLTLTPEGRRLVESSIGERYRWVEELVTHLSSAEQEQASQVLPVLVRCLEAIDTTPIEPDQKPISGVK
jgi:DNA-binding MarR family transcriptional regulator